MTWELVLGYFKVSSPDLGGGGVGEELKIYKVANDDKVWD
jgi:hypothetical protein